ncbi:MAG: hypothetical protein Kapaf2KO_14050 [Candidatus Kapaibacteriales bacterium]
MKNLFIFLFLSIAFNQLALSLEDDIVFKAMSDELDRNMLELGIEGLEKPYYIEYRIDRTDYLHIKYSLGSKLVQTAQTNTVINPKVRVGDYQFDNTNFFDINLSFFGSTDNEERYKNRTVPNELTYDNIRRNFWLATDVAYKHAAEAYSKKVSTLKNKAKQDTLRDFIKTIPNQTYSNFSLNKIDTLKLEDVVKSASEVFMDYPNIFKSSVGTENIPITTYYLNTEGTRYKRLDSYTSIEIIAYSKDKSGEPVYNYGTIYANTPSELPSKDSIVKYTRIIADELDAMINADELEEPYSGPILFTDAAAAELLAQGLGYKFIAQRKSISEGGFGGNEPHSELQNKIGARVVPENISIFNYADKRTYNSSQIIGNYEIDDSGLKPQNVTIVENGYLNNLLTGRTPTKRMGFSTASARGNGVHFGTLHLVNSNDSKKLNYSDLKQKMIELANKRSLPFSIVIKKILNQNIQYTSLYTAAQGDLKVSRGEGTYGNILAYKVFPDGTEELIQLTELQNLGIRYYKEILFTGNNEYVYNFLANSVLNPYTTGAKQYVECSVITPDLLFEDCEIDVLNTEYDKPPIAPPPSF